MALPPQMYFFLKSDFPVNSCVVSVFYIFGTPNKGHQQ